MRFADFACATQCLAIEDERGGDREEIAETKCEPLVQTGADRATKHLVERFAIPPAIHVGLAEAERALREDPSEKTRVMHLNVPRAGAVDLDVSRAKKIFDCTPRR